MEGLYASDARELTQKAIDEDIEKQLNPTIQAIRARIIEAARNRDYKVRVSRLTPEMKGINFDACLYKYGPRIIKTLCEFGYTCNETKVHYVLDDNEYPGLEISWVQT